MNIAKSYPVKHWAKGVFPYLLAALIGFVSLIYFYPLSFIFQDGVGLYRGDIASSVSGYYAFRDVPWHFPIFYTDRLNYPQGISIINTDSIPLGALLFKFLAPLLPVDFQYFRLWVMFVYMFQAVSAVFLIRQMGCKRWTDSLLASAFAVIVPCFALRAGHTSLMTQGLILLGLGLYVRGVRLRPDSPSRGWFIAWMGLLACTFLIHPYFTAMLLPLYWAALLDIHWGRISAPRLLGQALLPLMVLALVFLGFWYVPHQSGIGKDDGFGVYSMNLLGPIVGGSILPWDVRLRTFPWIQNFEGQNYLGLGGLGLISAALLLHRQRLKELLRRYRFFLLVAVGFSIFAVSNNVYFGKRLIFVYPEWLSQVALILGSRFRASGRFFWPVGYMALFAGLAGVLAGKRRYAFWLVLSLLVIQWMDVPKFSFANYVGGDVKSAEVFPPEVWAKLLAGKRELYLTPAWTCGGDPINVPTLQLLAVKNRVLVNTAYGSRQNIDCVQKQQDVLDHLDSGSVHYFSNTVDWQQIKTWVGPKASEWCRALERGTVCVPYPQASDRAILDGPPFQPIAPE